MIAILKKNAEQGFLPCCLKFWVVDIFPLNTVILDFVTKIKLTLSVSLFVYNVF